ncbi:YezD family protein [Cohnella sp. GCM10012308]|uniref:YezD family protein n=1 Tax=Cohnella sp. GCM10012308 TaxID=3317329 RepID=UPI00360CAFFD
MAKPLELNDSWIQRITEAVEGLQYGNVQIIVHDGRIVQIERTERRRFDEVAERRGVREVPQGEAAAK